MIPQVTWSFIRWIKKQFYKKEYNYENIQIMEAVKDSVKKYQWKKGENFGKVVEVLEQDEKFTKFTDGSQIFNNAILEFLEEVVGDKLPFPGADSLNMLSKGEVPNSIKKNQTKTKESIIEIQQEISPLEELVGKLSKKNIEPLSTVINLNIPNRQIFNMLIESADEDRDNLIETIARVAVSQIEINKLQEYLKEEVTKFINNYYNE
jgi:flagellar basal body-associated protein FliL